jgi:hypothetical protein
VKKRAEALAARQTYKHTPTQQASADTREVKAEDDSDDSLCLSSQVDDAAPKFLVDSGADNHVCKDRELFVEMHEQPMTLKGFQSSASALHITHCGTICLYVRINGEVKKVKLSDVAYVPEARVNLISASTLQSKGMQYTATAPSGAQPGRWTCYRGGMPVLQAELHGKRLMVTTASMHGSQSAMHIQPVVAKAQDSLKIWHERLGHLGKANLVKALASCDIKAAPGGDEELAHCTSCLAGKQHRLPFPHHSTTRASQVLERVHSDICGPFRTQSMGGSKYFATLIDDRSRHVEVYFLKTKGEFAARFKEYCTFWSKHKRTQLKYLHSDNGGEYTSDEMRDYCLENGVKQEFTVPETPEQNGVAERMNRTIVERGRAMLDCAGMPAQFWAEAMLAASDITNNVPCVANEGVPPVVIWDGAQPQLATFKVFGCAAYAHTQGASKLDSRTVECVYLGRDKSRKGWRLWSIKDKRVFTSRDVHFNEQLFPFKEQRVARTPLLESELGASQPISSSAPQQQESRPPTVQGAQPADKRVESPTHAQSHAQAQRSDGEEKKEAQPAVSHDAVRGGAQDDAPQRAADPAPAAHEPTVAAPSAAAAPPAPATPAHAQAEQQPIRISSRVNKGAPPTKAVGEWYFPMSTGEWAVMQASIVMDEPRSLSDALRTDEAAEWKAAADREYAALMKNETWELTPLPPGRKPIKTTWVFRRKLKDDGTIDKYKARLCAKGFQQIPGLDYDETFAPVAQYKSLRTILAIAAQLDLNIHQLDVKSAFLNGKIDHELYMEQPDGYRDGTNRVCLLKKALYGLKQASRAWNSSIHTTLTSMGLQQCQSDPCVYFYHSGDTLFFLVLWVDDMITVTNSIPYRDEVIGKLSATYEIDDRGELKWVLGMRVTRDTRTHTISVDQHLYTNRVLDKWGMSECKPASTPAQENASLTTDDDKGEKKEVDATIYRSLVGSLLHASNCTRPDISFAVGNVARFMSAPNSTHMVAAKRILRYLKGKEGLCLRYKQQPAGEQKMIHTVGYTDASWASATESRRSVSGYVFFLSGAPISWSSKAQQSVALSSAEAEYVAMSAAAQEAKWLATFLGELGFPQGPITLYVDNQSAKAIAENPIHHARTKHIDVRYHFIRDLISNGVISLQWCPTESMTADTFTKALGKEAFTRHRTTLLTPHIHEQHDVGVEHNRRRPVSIEGEC